MILVRDVFQAKYGKGGDLVALFKEARGQWPQLLRRAGYRGRRGADFHIFTDASGPFFTVVTQRRVANMAEWERLAQAFWALPEFPRWFERMVPLVESGRREFYNIEAE
ncbi:MAG: hypothetical protein HY533_05975 [Chloroflexi bacterium]|nr:hypothetical protein [Chloroflexota bacterium]